MTCVRLSAKSNQLGHRSYLKGRYIAERRVLRSLRKSAKGLNKNRDKANQRVLLVPVLSGPLPVLVHNIVEAGAPSIQSINLVLYLFLSLSQTSKPQQQYEIISLPQATILTLHEYNPHPIETPRGQRTNQKLSI